MVFSYIVNYIHINRHLEKQKKKNECPKSSAHIYELWFVTRIGACKFERPLRIVYDNCIFLEIFKMCETKRNYTQLRTHYSWAHPELSVAWKRLCSVCGRVLKVAPQTRMRSLVCALLQSAYHRNIWSISMRVTENNSRVPSI